MFDKLVVIITSWCKSNLYAARLKLTQLCALLTCSVVSDFVALWTVAHQAPPSMGFSRQEYWNGLPCPPPGDLPNPRIELRSPALQAFFTPWASKEAQTYVDYIFKKKKQKTKLEQKHPGQKNPLGEPSSFLRSGPWPSPPLWNYLFQVIFPF